jgi:hypothetical protein
MLFMETSVEAAVLPPIALSVSDQGWRHGFTELVSVSMF